MTASPLDTLMHDIALAGGRLVVVQDRVTLTAPTPLPPALIRRVREHKSDLVHWLSTPPANQPLPCQHARIYARADGSRLCTSCWQALAPGSTTWAPEPAPVRCADDQHEPYPPHPSMPGIRQCQRCPAVWREAPAPPATGGGARCPWCDAGDVRIRGDAYRCRTCKKAF